MQSQNAMEPCTLRTAWMIVRGCSRGLVPSVEKAMHACEYLQRQIGLDKSSPAVQLLNRAAQGVALDYRLQEEAAAEVDRLLSVAKARLVQSLH